MAASKIIYRGSPPYLLRQVLLHKPTFAPQKAPGDPWTLFWKGGRFTRAEAAEGGPEHIYNHFPETSMLTRKGLLQYVLKSARLDHGDIYNFFPMSYVYFAHSRPILQKYFDKPDKLWIGKPSASSQGRGIYISDHLAFFDQFITDIPTWERERQRKKRETENARRQVEGFEDPAKVVEFGPLVADAIDATDPEGSRGRDLVVVQEYIRNPFLVKGYKHDLRLYVLVTSYQPLRAYLYLDGLARFCTRKYSTTDFDLLRHLTNTSIHTKVFGNGSVAVEELEEFRTELNSALGDGDFSKWRIRSLLAYLRNAGHDHKLVWNRFYFLLISNIGDNERIRNVIRLTLLTVADQHIPRTSKCFELLGFDVMLTDDLQAKLIEVNLGPSLAVHCPLDRLIKEPMLSEMVDIVFPNGQELKKRYLPLEGPNEAFTGPQAKGDYELLFPFSESSLDASNLIAAGVNKEKHMKAIIDEIRMQER